MDEKLMMDVVPGLEGIPAAESAISFIDGEAGILEYRGITVEALAEKSDFLETAWLLIFGRLPKKDELDKWRTDITYHTRLKLKILRMMEYLPENGHPMHYLQAVTSAMGMYYPARDTLDAETRYWSAVRLIAKMPTIVAACMRLKHGDAPIQPRNDLSFAANFYYMLNEHEPSALVEQILDAMLTLHADHTMNASTFSARVVGSTLADPYTVVSSAIGTLSGPLHGGANEEVVHMIDEIGSKENVRPYIERKLERKEKIMGVGHRVYRTRDPRGEVLKGFIRELAGHKAIDLRTIEISAEIESVVKEKLEMKHLHPNVDFYSGIVFKAIGIPTELFTPIFAMGRVAGWLAHWMEQLKTNRIYRPTQKYTGLRAQVYAPVGER
ncbi:MAG: citrate synthase [Deltaproteobacteria bacterium GWB2_55_19]|nr:MAG: citrate synthase [Deltaproteobacteria bacterium GWB2_55_19]